MWQPPRGVVDPEEYIVNKEEGIIDTEEWPIGGGGHRFPTNTVLCLTNYAYTLPHTPQSPPPPHGGH